MPTWSNKLPTVGKHQGFDLRRTPAAAALNAIITSEELLVCDTHFWHGRTMPCERIVNADGRTIDDSPCAACLDKQPYRTHAYVSAFAAKTHEHFIFECTGPAAKPLEEHFDAAGTLRGCQISANRPKGGANSKVVIVTGIVNPRNITLPNAPNVAAALAVIWRLPKTAITEVLERSNVIDDKDGYATTQKTIHTVSEVLTDIRTQEDDADGPETFERRKAAINRILAGKAAGNGQKKTEKEPA